MLAGTCGRAGTAGIFAYAGGTWHQAAPSLPAVLAGQPVRVLRLSQAGRCASRREWLPAPAAAPGDGEAVLAEGEAVAVAEGAGEAVEQMAGDFGDLAADLAGQVAVI